MYNIIFSIIIGLISGIIKGWHKMPINHYVVMMLLLFNVVDDKTNATGTVSFIVLGLSLIYAIKMYNKTITIDTNIAFIILLFTLIGNYIGEYLSNYINKKITNISIVIGFIITTIYFSYYFKIF